MIHSQIADKNIAYHPAGYLTQFMKELFQEGKKLADRDNQSILIMGERGTGKELLANSIHYNASLLSPNAPFVTINCVDLPFSHFKNKIKHCFDIFSKNKASLSDKSDSRKPTLFFRNIDKLTFHTQTDLCKLLEEKLCEPPDGTDHNLKKIRLFFSCNNNELNPENINYFDQSLHRAFKPSMISVLPLRSRKEDIQPLALFFADKFSKEYGEDIGGIHSSASKKLEAYPWPGNVSELRDVMENAVLLSQSPLITKDDIRFNISKKSIALESFLSREDFFKLEELEKIYIQTVFRRVKNNKSKAAKILGISRNTLQRRLESFNTPSSKTKSANKRPNQPPLF